MATIRINRFSGEMPRIAPRQLDPSAAQSAINCNLDMGSLKPFKNVTGGTGTPLATAVTRTVFKLNYDMHLLFSSEYVDVVRSHAYASGDRFYWSEMGQLKQSDWLLASHSGVLTKGYPYAYWYLGVPTPTGALTATATGAPGYALEKSVSYVYTYVAEFGSTIREGPPSPVSNTLDIYENQYVALTGLPSSYTSGYNIKGVRIYRLETGTSGSNYELLDHLLTTGKQYTEYAATLYDRVTASFPSGTGTISSTGTAVTGVGTVFTSQLAAGMFIVPAAVSQARKIVTIISDTSLTVEFDFSPALSAKAFTYSTGYTLMGTAEIISTEDYTEPPTGGVSGLIELSNGCYAACEANKVYLSEPYLPDAWPYDVSCTEHVIALGYYGTTLVAATYGAPYKIDVYDPKAITKQVLQQKQRCLWKRSMVSGETFCIYACPDGLFYVGADGDRILTEGILTKDQWKALLTKTTDYDKEIVAFYFEQKYYAFFVGTGEGFIVDFAGNSLQSFVRFDLNAGGANIYVYGGYIDETWKTLTLVAKVGYSGNNYYLLYWNKATVDMSYRWQSKTFSYPADVSFERVAINADFSTVGINCYVYCEKRQVHPPVKNPERALIKTHDPFAIPYDSGKEWEIVLSGTREVYEVIMTTSMGEMVEAYQTG